MAADSSSLKHEMTASSDINPFGPSSSAAFSNNFQHDSSQTHFAPFSHNHQQPHQPALHSAYPPPYHSHHYHYYQPHSHTMETHSVYPPSPFSPHAHAHSHAHVPPFSMPFYPVFGGAAAATDIGEHTTTNNNNSNHNHTRAPSATPPSSASMPHAAYYLIPLNRTARPPPQTLHHNAYMPLINASSSSSSSPPQPDTNADANAIGTSATSSALAASSSSSTTSSSLSETSSHSVHSHEHKYGHTHARGDETQAHPTAAVQAQDMTSMTTSFLSYAHQPYHNSHEFLNSMVSPLMNHAVPFFAPSLRSHSEDNTDTGNSNNNTHCFPPPPLSLPSAVPTTTATANAEADSSAIKDVVATPNETQTATQERKPEQPQKQRRTQFSFGPMTHHSIAGNAMRRKQPEAKVDPDEAETVGCIANEKDDGARPHPPALQPSFVVHGTDNSCVISFPPLPTNTNHCMTPLDKNASVADTADDNDVLSANTMTAAASSSFGDSFDHDMAIAVNSKHQTTTPSIAKVPPPPTVVAITAAAKVLNTAARKRSQTGRKRKPKPTSTTTTTTTAYKPPMRKARKLSSQKKVRVTATNSQQLILDPYSILDHQHLHLHHHHHHSCSDTGVPALNRIHISPSSKTEAVVVRRIPKRRPAIIKRPAISQLQSQRMPSPPAPSPEVPPPLLIALDVPSLCPIDDMYTDTNQNTTTHTNSNASSNSNTNTEPVARQPGQMDVAYSQQYPQVGFPFIYNDADMNGKQFTCKFMDCSSSSSGAAAVNSSPMFCNRQFAQKCHWMRHCLEKHVPVEMGQRYACRYCDMKYAQNSSLKEHVAVCHSTAPPAHKCPYCAGDVTFTRWTSVLRHCRNQHSDQPEPPRTAKIRLPKKEKAPNQKTGKPRGRKKKTETVATTTDINNNNMDAHSPQPPNIMPSAHMNMSNDSNHHAT